MTEPIYIRFEEVAGGTPYHAARSTLSPAPGQWIARHTHDYYELMFITSGQGMHVLEDAGVPLAEGTLALVRPRDIHSVRGLGRRLELLNVAFPRLTWRRFVAAAEMETTAREWDASTDPVAVVLQGGGRHEVEAAMRRAVQCTVQSPSLLELFRCLSQVLAHLVQPEPADSGTGGAPPPQWLVDARRAMADPAALRRGVSRLQELSGVSDAHLSRSMRACYGQTPTEFINALRLEYAASVLCTSDDTVESIAARCGFHNLSHFYRLFLQRYSATPRAYRRNAARGVLPSSGR